MIIRVSINNRKLRSVMMKNFLRIMINIIFGRNDDRSSPDS